MVKGHIWENKSYSSLKNLIYSSRAWDFAFRKLEFDKICYVYSNKSPFKYYISILEGVGAMLILIFKTVKWWNIWNIVVKDLLFVMLPTKKCSHDKMLPVPDLIFHHPDTICIWIHISSIQDSFCGSPTVNTVTWKTTA